MRQMETPETPCLRTDRKESKRTLAGAAFWDRSGLCVW